MVWIPPGRVRAIGVGPGLRPCRSRAPRASSSPRWRWRKARAARPGSQPHAAPGLARTASQQRCQTKAYGRLRGLRPPNRAAASSRSRGAPACASGSRSVRGRCATRSRATRRLRRGRGPARSGCAKGRESGAGAAHHRRHRAGAAASSPTTCARGRRRTAPRSQRQLAASVRGEPSQKRETVHAGGTGLHPRRRRH